MTEQLALEVESGTEFFAAETGRQNGLIHVDCRKRDRAYRRIRRTCLWDCGAIASGLYLVQLQGVRGGGSRAQTGDPPPSHRTSLRRPAGNGNSDADTGTQKPASLSGGIREHSAGKHLRRL